MSGFLYKWSSPTELWVPTNANQQAFICPKAAAMLPALSPTLSLTSAALHRPVSFHSPALPGRPQTTLWSRLWCQDNLTADRLSQHSVMQISRMSQQTHLPHHWTRKTLHLCIEFCMSSSLAKLWIHFQCEHRIRDGLEMAVYMARYHDGQEMCFYNLGKIIIL